MQFCVSRGITMVSVGHRHTLLQYHKQVLELDGQGSYTIRALSPPAVPVPAVAADALHPSPHKPTVPYQSFSVSGNPGEFEVSVGDDDTTNGGTLRRRRARTGSHRRSSVERDATGVAVRTSDLFGELDYDEQADNPWDADIFKAAPAIDPTVQIDAKFARRLWRLFRAGLCRC